MSKRSPETQALVQYLRDCGDRYEVATFEGMKEILHCDVQTGTMRNNLTTAIEIVQKEHDYVFESVVGVGYRRLRDHEIPGVVTKKRSTKINNEIGRWRNNLECVNISNLDQESLKQFFASQVKLSAYEMLGTKEFSQSVNKSVEEGKITSNIAAQQEAIKLLRDVS